MRRGTEDIIIDGHTTDSDGTSVRSMHMLLTAAEMELQTLREESEARCKELEARERGLREELDRTKAQSGSTMQEMEASFQARLQQAQQEAKELSNKLQGEMAKQHEATIEVSVSLLFF